MCDNDILRLLADHSGHSLSGMARHFQVTLTAIRNRLLRLMQLQSVSRQRDDERRRGRPQYVYYITPRGEKALQSSEEDSG
jgi:predicted ArsR family transcriptional regulator